MLQDTQDHVAGLLPALVAGTLDRRDAEPVRAHLAACAECRSAAGEWEIIGAATRAAGAPFAEPSRGLLDRAFAKIDASERRPRWYEGPVLSPLRRPVVARSLAAGLAAAALAALVVWTPLGSSAQGLLDVFQPKQFAIVPVTWDDLRALPSLDEYGDLTPVSHDKPQRVASAAAAAAASGMRVLTPAALPPSVTSAPTYAIVPSQSATFTFSAAKARQAALARGKEPPPMPANVDGSSVQITTGMAVIAAYGGDPDLLAPAGTGKSGDRGPGRPGAGAERPPGDTPRAEMAEALPQLVVAQAYAPVAHSSGASPRELQRYLLSQPGISDNLANAIRAIGDPTTTWPILVPLGKVNTHSVSVQGVRGTLFAEASGFATGVIWVRDGLIHAVGGPLSESEVLGIANSLR